jgi:uncharacterized BrkB/YihY/UPF0761 family membrane protein
MGAETIIAATALIVILLFAFFGALIMAGIAELNAALDTQAQAITDLTARIAALPGAIDLQSAVDRVNAQTAELNTLAQPTP